MHRQPLIDGAPRAAQALRTAASVIGVVVFVLALLALGVYAVVAVDLMPQMR
jgi:hypothetical protein